MGLNGAVLRKEFIYFHHVIFMENLAQVGGKSKVILYRLWRPLGLREAEAPTFSDIRLIVGGKVVSLTHRLLFTPRKIPGTHFC
jgi:hypothetical protein